MLILSYNRRLGLSKGIFPVGLPAKTRPSLLLRALPVSIPFFLFRLTWNFTRVLQAIGGIIHGRNIGKRTQLEDLSRLLKETSTKNMQDNKQRNIPLNNFPHEKVCKIKLRIVPETNIWIDNYVTMSHNSTGYSRFNHY